MITIISPFASVEIPMEDLTTYERNALAQLLGVSGARAEAFETLREMKVFQKIKPEMVWRECRKFNRFKTTFTLEFINGTPEGEAMKLPFIELMPDAEISAANHIVSGFCRWCKTTHSITKPAVMVRTIVHGLEFSNLYAPID